MTAFKVLLPPELENRRTELEARAQTMVREHYVELDMVEYLPLSNLTFEVTSSVPLRYRWGTTLETGGVAVVKEGEFPCP
jgi:hypothetical protein